MLSPQELIDYNTHKHDQIAATEGTQSYDARHIEIFNPTEQSRLKSALDHALALRETANPRVLDFGCGTGNLTGKLLGAGREVWATDVSQGMCDLVGRRFSDSATRGELKTERLTGEFPLPFPDNHFSFIATYSVLHHVPDYLLAVRELIRVLDVGGVLYIDHEASSGSWNSPFGMRLYRLLLRPYWGIPRFLRRVAKRHAFPSEETISQSPSLPEEGDIHIFPHDHIEWKLIREIAKAGGISEVPTRPYLACTEVGHFPIRHWICRKLGNDTQMFVGLKS